ncbi:MAG: hypothetical protein ABSF59_13865 [Candidatus Sulfotelmatobacter sp.]
MPEESPTLNETLSRHELELARLKEAFALLGVNACSWCKKFYRTDPGALFEAGGLTCYSCIREWWPQRCAQLSTKERQDLETKLVFWLRDFHHAELFKDTAKLPDPAVQELNIVANFSSQFSVLSSQFSVLSSQFSVLSSQFSVLSKSEPRRRIRVARG